jgi:hypothetical protein
MQLEGENSTQSGKHTKETTMSHGIMMSLGNTGITGVILTNRIFGNTLIGKGNERETVRDLSLSGTETMRGGPLSEVRVQCT